MKILIVNDNSAMLEMIRSFLPRSFDDICECEDSSDALDCYRSFLPDWVLIDWEMKRMNGLSALREILADFPEAKIIFVTHHDDPEIREAVNGAGAKAVILKEDLAALRPILEAKDGPVPGTF